MTTAASSGELGRRRRSLTVLWILVAATVAVGAGFVVSSTTARGDHSSPTPTVRLDSSPCASDPIPVPRSWLGGSDSASVVTARLSSGATLVVVSSWSPTGSSFAGSFAVAEALNSDCAPDMRFGNHGVERLRFGGEEFWIETAARDAGGDVLLGGQTANGWLVARLKPGGQLDRGFGRNGFTVLPWQGGPSAIAQEPTGDIVLGGSVGGGCCVQEWVGELTSRGKIVHSFGRDGRTGIPVLEDSGVARVAVERDGEILALTLGGNMGCWNTTVAALTPGGTLVPSFQRNFDVAIDRALPFGDFIGSSAFVGDVVLRDGGFLLVGTGQVGCIGNQPSPRASGDIVAFTADGQVDGAYGHEGVAHFSSPMEGSTLALPESDGRIVVIESAPYFQSGPHTRASLSLVELSPNGGIDRDYGDQGKTEVQLPYLVGSMAALSFNLVGVTPDGTVTAVTSTADGKALEFVRISGQLHQRSRAASSR